MSRIEQELSVGFLIAFFATNTEAITTVGRRIISALNLPCSKAEASFAYSCAESGQPRLDLFRAFYGLGS